MKVPVGEGMFPAFWLLGDNISDVGHPQAGEIDVMESLGHNVDEVQQHAHGWTVIFRQLVSHLSPTQEIRSREPWP